MNTKLIALSALAALITAGCGGGGSSESTSGGAGTSNPPVVIPPPAASKLAAYIGSWTAACDQHELASLTITETPGVKDSIDLDFKSEYYKNSGCTGAIVGTETRGAKYSAAYTGTADSAIVFSAGSAAVPSKVDLATVRAPAYALKVEGSGVVRTIKNSQAQWCMDFGDGSSTCVDDDGLLPGLPPTNVGLHAKGNAIYTLFQPSNNYSVDQAYFRR